MKDAVATMGNVLPEDVGGRDAVHVAVIAVTAAGGVWSGSDVGIQLTDKGYIASRNLTPFVGIADPFIKTTIGDGQRFWLFLYPRSITSLAHAWKHPAFPDNDTMPAPKDEKAASESWLREFVARSDCPAYDELVPILKRIAEGETRGSFGEDGDYNYSLDEEYLYFGGTDAHGEIPPEFWTHASVVVGRPIRGGLPTYFSCSC